MSEPVIVTVPLLLTPVECREQIAQAESAGFEEAPITTGGGFVQAPEIRNNTRVMRDDPAMARSIWSRLRLCVPETHLGWTAVGLNERLRLYRYTPGQYFRLHRDGAFVRTPTEQSLLTVLIYLNEEFSGGETRVVGSDKVRPRTGLGFIFSHELLHESAALRSGRKYVLRSDVMYRRPGVEAG